MWFSGNTDISVELLHCSYCLHFFCIKVYNQVWPAQTSKFIWIFLRNQLLQIQEVHPGSHSNAWNFCCFHLYNFITILSWPFVTPKTKRKSNLLSSHSKPEDIHELRSENFCASALKGASRKKWETWVPLDRFPWLHNHSVAPVKLCNMILESRFSTEWFLSYMLLKLVQNIFFQCMIFGT